MKNNKIKKRKLKKLLWLIPVVVILVIVITTAGRKGNSVAPMVTVVHGTYADLQDEVNVNGTVRGSEEFMICAPVSGVAKNVNASVGDLVKQGDILLTYDIEQMEKNLYQAGLQWERSRISYDSTMAGDSREKGLLSEAEVNLKVLNQQIADSRSYLKSLQEEMVRLQQENSNGLVIQTYNLQKQMEQLAPGSEEYKQAADQLAQIRLQQSLAGTSDAIKDYEKKIEQEQEKLSGYERYKAEMESQKAVAEKTTLDSFAGRQLEIDRELAELSYTSLQEDYEKAKPGVAAPANGVITSRVVSDGSMVSGGMQMMVLESVDQLKVTANASKQVMTKLQLDQKVEAVINGKTYEGRVSRISHMAFIGDAGGNNVAFEVELNQGDENIILGMDAKMKIFTARSEGAFCIPVQAVNADKSGDFVYVVENNIVHKKRITCGISTYDSVEILEGITEKDMVIQDYSGELEEGMVVAVTEAE